MRKLLFWFHLALGVSAGAVILIMSVTGVLLMYEKQMIAWFDQRDLPALSAGERRSVEELLTEAKAQKGMLPQALTVAADASVPVQLTYGREVFYQDPASGRILGGTNKGARAFFRSVTDWHRWLAASGDSRASGKAVTGASNLAFLAIVLSGAYLWLPRVWSRASVRAIAWFRGGLNGKARDFNWHNTIGVWCLVPLAFIVLGATVISYPWASNLVFQLADGKAPPPAARPGGEPERGGERVEPGVSGLARAWEAAAKETPGWRTVSLRVPATEAAPVSFTVDQGYPGQPQKRVSLTIDRATGAVRKAERFTDLTAGRQWRTWLRFVHTGEYYGLPGQTIAGIASLGGAFLVWTGIALSLRRFAAWRRRNDRAQGTGEEEMEPESAEV